MKGFRIHALFSILDSGRNLHQFVKQIMCCCFPMYDRPKPLGIIKNLTLGIYFNFVWCSIALYYTVFSELKFGLSTNIKPHAKFYLLCYVCNFFLAFIVFDIQSFPVLTSTNLCITLQRRTLIEISFSWWTNWENFIVQVLINLYDQIPEFFIF